MKVPDNVRKTVGFIGYENKNTGDFSPVGTFFYLGHPSKQDETISTKMYAVTARHVLTGLKKLGVTDAILRLNSKTPEYPLIRVSVPICSWFFHSTDSTIDIAIYETGIPDCADHLVIPFNKCVSSKVLSDNEVDLGDEVFISGLFRHHFGNKKNIPIVRIGNLAALNEEKVQTDGFGEIDAFLIEARSIGGISGSPVFLNLGLIRYIDGKIKHANGPMFYLLGLIHGHFDVLANSMDNFENIDDDKKYKYINAGIGIVVPFESIMSVITEYEESQLR